MFKCLFYGTECNNVHLVSVLARIGVHVGIPHDLKTQYWIRTPNSENSPVSRDLRSTMIQIDAKLSNQKNNDLTVVFMDQVHFILFFQALIISMFPTRMKVRLASTYRFLI